MDEKENPNKKRRLLVVSQHFWPENFRVNDLVDGFLADGIEVDVLCGLPNYPAGAWFPGYKYTGPRRENYHGADVFRAGEIRRKDNTGPRIFLNYVSFPFFALFSLPRLAGRKYDAVLCYETSPVLMAFPAIVYAKTHGVPLCTYVLDLWPDNLYSVLPVKNRFLRRVALGVSNWHYRRCDKLIALNAPHARQIERQVFRPGKRNPQMAVIPQHAEDFYAEDVHDAELAARFGGSEHFNILFAGNISPAQDLDNLVNAVALVRQAPGGEKVRVLILGDGMSKDALAENINRQGLEDAFTFCGTVPPQDIPRWTGIADALYAGLAKSENLGLTVPAKVATYFAAGRPILAAMDGAGAEAAAASGAALVSPAGAAQPLADNILALARMDAAQRAKMGAAGRACYQRDYKRGTLLKKLEDFLFT